MARAMPRKAPLPIRAPLLVEIRLDPEASRAFGALVEVVRYLGQQVDRATLKLGRRPMGAARDR